MEPARIFFRRDAISTAVHRINWSTRAEASQKIEKLPLVRKPKDGVTFVGRKSENQSSEHGLSDAIERHSKDEKLKKKRKDTTRLRKPPDPVYIAVWSMSLDR